MPLPFRKKLALSAAESRNAANGKFHEIARRQARGQATDEDLPVLRDLLAAQTDHLEQKFLDERVAIVREYDQAVKEAVALPGAIDNKLALEKKLSAYAAESRRIIAERNAAVDDMLIELRTITANLASAEKAKYRADALSFDHADLLGVSRPDNLDGFTLTCNGAVLNNNDPSAKYFGVSIDTFNAQNARRALIMANAEARMMADFTKKMKRHNEIYGRDRRNSTPPPVRPDSPTWADLIKSGRIAENEVPFVDDDSSFLFTDDSAADMPRSESNV